MKKGLYNTGATKLKNIFLAPLEAVIQADFELSERITDFIMEYGFYGWNKKKPSDEKKKMPRLRMVSFSYVNGEGKKEVLTIPVLTLIQLPMLRIKDANFDMKVKMITVDVDEAPPPPSLLAPDPDNLPVPRKQTDIKAFITPETSGANMETMKSNMKVNLNMRDGDLPGGIIQLLSMMSELNRTRPLTPKEDQDYENET